MPECEWSLGFISNPFSAFVLFPDLHWLISKRILLLCFSNFFVSFSKSNLRSLQSGTVLLFPEGILFEVRLLQGSFQKEQNVFVFATGDVIVPLVSKDFTSPSEKSPVVPYKLIMIVSVYIVSVMQIVSVHGWTWAVQIKFHWLIIFKLPVPVHKTMLPTRILVRVCCCGSDQRMLKFSQLSPNSNFKWRRLHGLISAMGMGRWWSSTVSLIITGSNCTFTPGYPAKLIKTGRQWSHILPSQNSEFCVSRSAWNAADMLSAS